MRQFGSYLALAACLTATSVTAQDDEGGFLERQIEGLLSGNDRDVVIRGFEGLLSGQARFESLTISDPEGVWLTVTNAELDWSRLALLRGRLSVALLTAESIEVARPPLPAEGTLPDPEASAGFALPELPVAIQVDEISIDRLSLGEPLFGQSAEVGIAGSASLAGGEGSVSVEATRLDSVGTFTLDGSYANSSDILALALNVSEAPDGIVVNLANIHELPSLDLSITGEGPLSDYAADIRLATDGQERITGRVATRTSGEAGATTREIVADIGGDVTALFLPDYRDFFGTDLSLDLTATRDANGTIDVSQFDLEAQSLSLNGQVTVGPEGLPTRAAIDGDIGNADGSPVILPATGDPIQVTTATLNATFDASSGDDWTADITVTGLAGEGFSAERLSIDGGGTIVPRSPGRAVTGALALSAETLDLGDESVDAALGEDVAGQIDFSWNEGNPLTFSRLEIAGRDYGLDGSAEVSGFGAGFEVEADVTARADNLAAFSGIAGRPLSGAVTADLDGRFEALTGQFETTVSATTRDLSVGQAEADRILAGRADFALSAARDETGLRVEDLRLESPNARIAGSAALNSGESRANVEATLDDLALVLPSVTGPATLTLAASQAGNIWTYDLDGSAPGAALSAEGTADTTDDAPLIVATVATEVDDLSRFSDLAKRPLTGSVSIGGDVSGRTDLSTGSVDVAGRIDGVGMGILQLDALLRGASDLAVVASLEGGAYRVERLSLDGEAVTLNASGAYGGGGGSVEVDLAIADASMLAPDLEGPVSLAALASEDEGGLWTFDIDANGPSLSLGADGTAEPFATPATVEADLALDAPDLSVVSGLIGRSLAGAVSMSGSASLASDLSRIVLDISGNTQDIRIGIADVDRLLAGRGDIEIDADRIGDSITIRDLEASTPEIRLSATGGTDAGVGAIDLSATLNDLAVFLPGFGGSASIDGRATLDGSDRIGLDLTGAGPGGVAVRASGDTAMDASDLRMALSGNAPLGLANRFITPISVDGVLGFDMNIAGPPALSSVTGTLSSSGVRLVVPNQNIVLENIAVTTRLAGESATLDVSAAVAAGGQIGVSGPISLQPPFNGDLGMRLASVVLTDGALYTAQLDGDVGINGPLTGGATIGGQIQIREAEINIAANPAGVGGSIPEITHIAEPAAARQTRIYAGLLRKEGASGGGGGAAFPLNLGIDAQRIFVRGRGLDAELGGGLRVTGTTANVIPVGGIDLIRGRLNILGSRLNIQEGAIFLQGALVPSVRFRAASERRTNDDVDAFVSVRGLVTDPEITFESEPPLPEDEVLARILFGTDLSNISALQAAQLASAAATLAGKGGPGIVGGIRDNLGLDDLDVTTDESGNTAVTAGTYLSENVYADVTTRSDGESEINLNLDLSDSFTVTGSTANTGESSIGIYFQRDF